MSNTVFYTHATSVENGHITGDVIVPLEQNPDGSYATATFTGDSGSGGTSGSVPAPPAGSSAAGDFLSANGTWQVPPGGGGSVNLNDYLTDEGIYLGEESDLGIAFDATGGGNDNVGSGPGTGALIFTSAGGLTFEDNSSFLGVSIIENGTSSVQFTNNYYGLGIDLTDIGAVLFSNYAAFIGLVGGGLIAVDTSSVGISLDATGSGFGGGGTGPINLTSAGGVSITTNSVGSGFVVVDSSADGVFIGSGEDGGNAGIEIQTNDGGGTGPLLLASGAGGLQLNSAGGITIYETSRQLSLENDGPEGITIDATGDEFNATGTGPINLTSACGVFINDTSINGLDFRSGGGISLFSDENGGSNGIYIVTTDGAGTGSLNLASAGTIVLDDSALSSGSKLDLDATTPGVVTVSTIINAVGGYQENGVPVSSNFLADVTLSTAQLLEFNTTNTITAATNNGDGTTTYTGAFANGDANALVTGWYTIAGFGDLNDGTFGPVSASTLTSITLPNANGITEAGGVSALNEGFQLVPAQGVGKLIMPLVNAMYYTYVTTLFIVGNADNTFVLALVSSPSGDGPGYYAPQNAQNTSGVGILASGFVDQGFSNIVAASGYYLLPGDPPPAYTNLPLIIALEGTTPSLTAGDGSVEVKLQYTVM